MLNKSNKYMNYSSVSETVFRGTAVFRELLKVFRKFPQSLTFFAAIFAKCKCLQHTNAKCKIQMQTAKFAFCEN